MEIYVGVLLLLHGIVIIFGDEPKPQLVTLLVYLPIYGRILGMW